MTMGRIERAATPEHGKPVTGPMRRSNLAKRKRSRAQKKPEMPLVNGGRETIPIPFRSMGPEPRDDEIGGSSFPQGKLSKPPFERLQNRFAVMGAWLHISPAKRPPFFLIKERTDPFVFPF